MATTYTLTGGLSDAGVPFGTDKVFAWIALANVTGNAILNTTTNELTFGRWEVEPDSTGAFSVDLPSTAAGAGWDPDGGFSYRLYVDYRSAAPSSERTTLVSEPFTLTANATLSAALGGTITLTAISAADWADFQAKYDQVVAIGTTTDTIIASRIGDPSSATAVALDVVVSVEEARALAAEGALQTQVNAWSVFGVLKGNWTATTYVAGDIVNHVGSIWGATTAAVAGDVPGTAALWQQLPATVDAQARSDIGDEATIVRTTDPGIPDVADTITGVSIAFAAGQYRTWLEATSDDGGPSDYALDLIRERVLLPTEETYPGVSLGFAVGGYRTWLEVNDTDGGPTDRALALLGTQLDLAPVDTSFVADGDSMTQGGHGAGDSWPTLLAALTGRTVVNRGLSGTTAAEIALRHGGLVPMLTFPSNTLPAATTAATVTTNIAGSISASGQANRTYTGSVRGVAGTLAYNTTTAVWTFTRTTAGSAITLPTRAPFIADDAAYDTATHIIWAGRNNYPKSNAYTSVAAMVERQRDLGRPFVVISVCNRETEPSGTADYNSLIALNEQLLDLAPRDFIDLRVRLIHEGLALAGLTPTGADTTAISEDRIPPALLFDGLHLNGDGRIAAAAIIHDELTMRGLA